MARILLSRNYKFGQTETMKVSILIILILTLNGCTLYRKVHDYVMDEIDPQPIQEARYILTDTYVCENSRQIVINAVSEDNTAVIQFKGESYTLFQDKKDKNRFTNGTYTLHLDEGESPVLTREGVPALRNCERRIIR